jgi:abortive infection bacteriophage resistance protein
MKGNVLINGEIPSPKVKFNKPAMSVNQHIALLLKRGLIIKKEWKAKEYLSHISYYRLSGYLRFFYKDDDHNFQKGTTFDNVFDIYSFDRKLKILLLDILERIEISFKANMINILSEEHGPHWFLEPSNFTSPQAANNTFKIIEEEIAKNKKHNLFIKHYNNKYKSPKYPPSRMLFEILPFGRVGSIYQSLSRTNKNKIAKVYGINLYTASSRVDCLSYLRNLCAHSTRIWNRRMVKKVNIQWHDSFFSRDTNGDIIIDKLYPYIVIIIILLKKISPDSSWLVTFSRFVEQFKRKIDISQMGFPSSREVDLKKIWESKDNKPSKNKKTNR